MGLLAVALGTGWRFPPNWAALHPHPFSACKAEVVDGLSAFGWISIRSLGENSWKIRT